MRRIRWSIKQKLLLVICGLIFASVLLTTVLTYQNYKADLIQQSTRATQQLLDQIAINTDTYLDELFRLCLSPYYNRRVMQQLDSIPATAVERLQKQRIVEDYLSEVMTLPRGDILRAHILTDGVYSSSKTRYEANISANFRTEGWYRKAIATPGPIFIPVHTEHQGKTLLAVFSIVHQLCSTQDSGRVLGVIRVDANYRGIKTVCDRAAVTEGSALLILDNAGNRIYDNRNGNLLRMDVAAAVAKHQGQSTFSASMGNEDYLFNVKALTATDWHIIDVHSMRSITHAAVLARNKAFVLAFICAAAGVLVSVILVRLFLRPVFHITALMQKVQNGDLSVHAKITGDDELAFLARSFNEMIDQIHAHMLQNTLLTRQIYEARYLEKEAQYIALCNQIRPHFLFNVLSTINLLIKCDRSEEAIQCIDMLAVLLRGMVNTDRNISLSAEMKIVESYLILQQKRYGTLTYELPDIAAFGGNLIPALTVQPLVENALEHGCEPKRGATHIAIRVSVVQDEMHIVVADNGIGMNSQTLRHLQEILSEQTADPPDGKTGTGGVGLLNISRRVKLKYGLGYGLTIKSEEGQGTTATLRLPSCAATKGEVTCTEP